jgi:hypothetical protein
MLIDEEQTQEPINHESRPDSGQGMQYLGFNHTEPLASTAGPTTAFDEDSISLFKRVTEEVAHKAGPQSTIMSQVDNQVLNEIQYFDGATRFL